jgi:hypothetical protein
VRDAECDPLAGHSGGSPFFIKVNLSLIACPLFYEDDIGNHCALLLSSKHNREIGPREGVSTPPNFKLRHFRMLLLKPGHLAKIGSDFISAPGSRPSIPRRFNQSPIAL